MRKSDLRKKDVTFENGFYQCNQCKQKWGIDRKMIDFKSSGKIFSYPSKRLPNKYWLCPQGCNAD